MPATDLRTALRTALDEELDHDSRGVTSGEDAVVDAAIFRDLRARLEHACSWPTS